MTFDELQDNFTESYKQVRSNPGYRLGQAILNNLPDEVRQRLHEEHNAFFVSMWESKDHPVVITNHFISMCAEGLLDV